MDYGQIIFHLEDYYNYGGIISTTNSGKIERIENPAAPEKDTLILENDNSINIYNNLVVSEYWDKIGIQAPPGTRFILNTQEFIIGPSGVYELSEVIINNLRFIPLTNFEKDEDATQAALKAGKEKMQDALNNYSAQIHNLELTEVNVENYKENTEKYILDYEEGYNQYQIGLNGVYIENQNQFHQVQKNIIIDYRLVEKKEVNE